VGRIKLVGRLAVRDLRRRPAEAALLLLTLIAATATLTLGLVVRGVIEDPYQRTREATTGPDVVASGGSADLTALESLSEAPGVVAHSGPYPVTLADLKVNGRSGTAHVIGRGPTSAAVDRPKLTQGSWVRDGGVVVEAAFADALGIGEGDRITLNDRSFTVAGVAVTAASPPYPEVFCLARLCVERTGVVWLTQGDARGIDRQSDLAAYILYLKLADPSAAPAFIAAHNEPLPEQLAAQRFDCKPGTPCVPLVLSTWQEIRDQTTELVRNQRQVLVIGSRLIALLAVASVVVLVGGRMANQTRRVGLLKAVGGTPSLVAIVLLAEYVAIALVAAAAGMVAGWLTAPLVTDPSVGLLGSAGSPSLTLSTALQVTAVALGVTVAATLVPATRAARSSTVLALADAARRPRRTPWLIAMSARLPVPLLLGLRVAARRPRRLALSAASVFVTVSGIVAALGAHSVPEVERLSEFGLPGSRSQQLDQALLMITITLVSLAAINAIFITSATVIDNRHASALARALGATPHEVSRGLSAAQVLPAFAGALLGIPGGLGLLAVVDANQVKVPLWQLLAVVPATALVIAALTTIPARLGERRAVSQTLQSELV
jgi:putative ABC transport system permease protein